MTITLKRFILCAALTGLMAGSLTAAPKTKAPAAANVPVKVEFTADERSLLDDAADGKLDKLSFAEAALLASGVADRKQRQAYLNRLAVLEGYARQATAAARTPAAKAERLLVMLHAKGGPLKKYVEKQTRLDELLDRGTFNCVSSAVLYNVLARRLKLDVRGVEMPAHAFSVLCDGERRTRIETTNAKGFNPKPDEGPGAETKKEERREIGDLGLTALIAFNRGVSAAEGKKWRDAFRASLLAHRLDPDFKSGATNTHAFLSRWAKALAEEGRIDQALEVVNENAAVDPEPDAAHKLFLTIYDARGKKLLDAKDFAGAVALYRKAGERCADDERLKAHFEHQARACVDAWAGPHVRKKEWPKAIEVYKEALAWSPGNGHFEQNLKYCEHQLAGQRGRE